MKNIFLLFAVMGLIALSSSCSKEPVAGLAEEIVQVEPVDVVKLLSEIDNVKRYVYEEDGMELFAADLQLTQEQQQQVDNDLKVMEQFFAQQPLVKKKSTMTRSVGVEDEYSIDEVFEVFAGVMGAYSNYKGTSEQWSLALNEVISALGELPQKMVESSVVVDLKNLVESDLLRCQNEILTKYNLSEEEGVAFTKILMDLQLVLTSESFLLDIQDSKIENASSNGLTKGFFSNMKQQLREIGAVLVGCVVTVVGFGVGSLVGGPIGAGVGAMAGVFIGFPLGMAIFL